MLLSSFPQLLFSLLFIIIIISASRCKADIRGRIWSDQGCDSARSYFNFHTDILLVHWLRLEENGALQILSNSSTHCNGYNLKTLEDLKASSSAVFVTVTVDRSTIWTVLSSSTKARNATIKDLVDFAVSTGVNGIEFMPKYGSWSENDYLTFRAFVTSLTNSLSARGLQLILAVPAIASTTEQSWYKFKYKDFANPVLPKLSFHVMSNDYHYNYGAGHARAPDSWLKSVVAWVKARIPGKSVSFSISSDCYKGTAADFEIVPGTFKEMATSANGFPSPAPSNGGEEIGWTFKGSYYSCMDSRAMDHKKQLLNQLGISSVIVDYLAGRYNSWFSAARSRPETRAWFFPGYPACDSMAYLQNSKIDVALIEWMTLAPGGQIKILTEAASGCNGYSSNSLAKLRNISVEQYVTVSSSYANMVPVISSPESMRLAISQILKFVQENRLHGIDIDWEEYDKWGSQDFVNFREFCRRLGNALHGIKAKLQVDTIALTNPGDQAFCPHFTYEGLDNLPIDHIALMAYDYQFAYGCGQARSPTWWVTKAVEWIKTRISNIDRLVVGVPTDCYSGVVGSYSVRFNSWNNVFAQEGGIGNKAVRRDPESQELFWNSRERIVNCIDVQALRHKRNTSLDLGINRIAYWHAGGSPFLKEIIRRG